MTADYDVIIIGAGIAGMSALREISTSNKDGVSVLIISDEDRLPYKRTKISKFISKGFKKDEFALESENWFSENNIDILINKKVEYIDAEKKLLYLNEGTVYKWKKIILAPGTELQKIQGDFKEAENVFYVSKAYEVERLFKNLKNRERIAVIGAGVLGVEVAEQLSLMGKDVYLFGKYKNIMPDELNRESSEYLKELIKQSGIKLIPSRKGKNPVVHGADNNYTVLIDNKEYYVDAVVAAIGVKPNINLAEKSNLKTDKGILVNKYMQTSCSDVYAAGDAAQLPGGVVTHLWHAAEYQGMAAAKNLLGEKFECNIPKFRLKCEVFDHFFFSINKPSAEIIKEFESLECKGLCYQCFYFKDNRLHSVVMVDDKDRAKLYEKAVNEKWHKNKVLDLFKTIEDQVNSIYG